MEDINFIFKENDVEIDYRDLKSEEVIGINKNKYEFIYNLAFSSNINENESIKFLQLISKSLIKYIINTPKIELIRENVDIDYEYFNYDEIIDNIPLCIGYQHINKEWINNILNKLLIIYKSDIQEFDGTVELYFTNKSKKLINMSKIYFHLVEAKDQGYPFAFMATYTIKRDDEVKHYPLKYAIKEYEKNPSKLEELTQCLYKISNKSCLIKKLIASGEIFSPIFFDSDEAYTFLKEIDIYEKNGVVCRVPNWWENKEKNTTIKIDIEQKKKDGYGYFTDSILVNVSPKMYYEGVQISKEEIEEMLLKTEGLSFIKGKWIEINKKQLKTLLDEYENLRADGTTLSEVLRKYTALKPYKELKIEFTRSDWLERIAMDNLKELPEFENVSTEFNGKLRNYQVDGYKWLLGMSYQKFGICLADDMGLGKTVQILAFLLSYKKLVNKNVLLIVPASLVGNWEKEIKKFSPTIDYYIARKISADELKIKNSFLTITTYQVSQSLSTIYEKNWGIVILDEAQAIKNPETKQAKKIKSLKREMSIALTGTPIENNLLNLWSIFDFLNPGLLGSESEFRKEYDIKDASRKNVQRLVKIINPFILRRMKTDKKIIRDLPEKNDNIIYMELSKKQIILYKKVISELTEMKMSESNQFMQKRIILTAILHLKQICNHPSQFIGDNEYKICDSGKFLALKELCEIIFEKREKVLVFTQFKEIAEPLNNLLKDIFKIPGYVITGDTPINVRSRYIESFQTGNIPYMILSLKTAGVGLNLTAATNVIHFDRWWNPAVENQATDRTYRIGQSNNVNVYKLITKDTIEEIIDHLINTKVRLSDSVIENFDTNVLNKLSNEELLESIKYTGENYDE